MHRALAATLLASALSLGIFACGQSGGDMGGDYAGTPDPGCSNYATCGACTPIVGCGWCAFGDGTGACAMGPEACGTQRFSWTWEPAGCSADGGVALDAATTSDGATTSDAAVATDAPASSDAPPTSDAPASTDAPPASDAPAATDAAKCVAPATGTTACVQTTGGTLCGATEATVACHGSDPSSTPAPSASANCRQVAGPAGAVFYCCPCAS